MPKIAFVQIAGLPYAGWLLGRIEDESVTDYQGYTRANIIEPETPSIPATRNWTHPPNPLGWLVLPGFCVLPDNCTEDQIEALRRILCSES